MTLSPCTHIAFEGVWFSCFYNSKLKFHYPIQNAWVPLEFKLFG